MLKSKINEKMLKIPELFLMIHLKIYGFKFIRFLFRG